MGIAVVIRKEGFSSGAGASVATASFNAVAGNLIHVWVDTHNQGDRVIVTDTAGNVYREIGTANITPDGINWQHQFYARNILGNAANVVTATVGNAGGYTSVVAYHVSGCDPLAPLVDWNKGVGAGTSFTCGMLTVKGNCIAFQGGIAYGQSIVAGSGYTLTTVTDGAGGFTADEYKLVSASELPTMTCANGVVAAIGATYREASPAPPAEVSRRDGNSNHSTTCSTSSSFNAIAGNLIHVLVITANGALLDRLTSQPVTVTDTAGNVYEEIGGPIVCSSIFQRMFYAKNIKGHAANIVTATIVGGGSSVYNTITAYQLSGCDPVAPLQDYDAVSTDGHAVTSISTRTLTMPRGIIVAGGQNNSALAGSGYTLTVINDGFGGLSADEYHVITAGREAASFSSSGAPAPMSISAAAYAAVPGTTVVTIEAKLNGVWTDITNDRAHLDGQPMNLTGGGTGTGIGDVVAEGGQWTFSLNNAATNDTKVQGCYSPNSPTPRPGWGINTMVRLGITIGTNPTYYKFVGWVDDYDAVAGLFNEQIVNVVAVDYLTVASTMVPVLESQANKRGDQLMERLVTSLSVSPTATQFDVGTDTYTLAFDDIDPQTGRALGAFGSIASSGIDRVYIKGDGLTGGVLDFESHSFRRTFITDAFALGEATAGGFGLADIQGARRRPDLINQLLFTMHPANFDSGTPVVLYALNIDASTVQSIAPAGGTQSFWITYADPNQKAQKTALYPGSGVPPVATTDYLFNSVANGSGTNLTASVTVTVAFFSTRAKVTITNNHATLPAFPTMVKLRGFGLYRYQALTAESVSTAVQGLNGPAPVAVDQPYQSVINQAQAAADYFLALRTSVAWATFDSVQAFCSADDQVPMLTLLAAEVSTAFAVTETVKGFLNYPLWVNGWSIDIDERNNMTFNFYPEPRDPNQYWSLGVAGLSELGVTTYLGPF